MSITFETGAIAGMDVRIEGSLWNANPTSVEDIVTRRLEMLGKALEQWAIDHGPQDTGVSVHSVRSDVFMHSKGDFELVVSAQAPQAYWSLEAGRGPGGYPPFDRILGWVARKQATSKQIRGVRAVGRVEGRSHRGGVAPVTAPWERGMGPHSGSGLDRLGGRKGKSFARKSAFETRVEQATAQFSDVRREDVNAAFAIMYSIGRRGSRSKPMLFTRMFGETDWALDNALKGIQSDLVEVLGR